MSLMIHGASGPFNPSVPGAFGANAAFNFQFYTAQNAQAASLATIAYTQPQNRQMADAFGYAQEDIRRLDLDHDGELNQQELTQALGGNTQAADTFIKVLDSDRNGKVGVVEDATYVLFQDDAMAQTYQAILGFTAQGLLTPQQAYTMISTLGTVSQGATSQADGQITSQERNFAGFVIQNMPFLASQIIHQFPGALSLRERYQQFVMQSYPRA